MNKPVTRSEMDRFKYSNEVEIGGKEFIASDINGKPIYVPNRKERRAKLNVKSGNNRKQTRARKKITLYNKDENGKITGIRSQFNTVI